MNRSPLGIRPAIRDDLPRVWELVNELADYEHLSHTVSGSAADLERYAFDEKVIDVFVAEKSGQVVGYSISFASFSTFRAQAGIWLEDLYVTPSERGNGYGKALIQNLMRTCETRGFGRLEWSVLDWNESAIRFYEAMGATVLPDWRICRVSFTV